MAKGDSAVIIAAFMEDETSRLTGVSLEQLRYWHRTGFFSPSLVNGDEESAVGDLYSFRDLVCLQVLNTLRNSHGVSLQHLREVKTKLAGFGDDVWAKTTLYVLNKRVVVENVATGVREDVISGQGVLRIPLEVARANMIKSVEALRASRDERLVGRIDKKKGVARSRPIIAGTGIRVDSVKAFIDAGYSVQQILSEYPTLTERDIEAAIAHHDAA